MAICSCQLDTEASQPEEVLERCCAKFLFDRLGIRIVFPSLLEHLVNRYNFFGSMGCYHSFSRLLKISLFSILKSLYH